MALRDRLRFSGRTSGSGWQISNIVHMCWRFLQIIMACVVIGYYASDLNAAGKVHKYSDSKWVFAVVVGTMSAITALIFGIISFISQYRTVAMLFPWEWILVILWSAVTGLFGTMYFHEKSEMDHGVEAMVTAAGFDVVNLVFWAVTAIAGTAIFFMSGKKSLHTGRANL